MKRTAFFLIFFVIAVSFGVMCQEMDAAYEGFEEPAEQGWTDSAYTEPYDDSAYDILYNDPLIDQTAAAQTQYQEEQLFQDEPVQAAAEESDDIFQYGETVKEQPVQVAPVLQPAQPMPPPAQTTQTVQPVQPAQTVQTVQPAQTPVQTAPPAQTPAQAPVQSAAARAQSSMAPGVVPLTWELVSLIQNTNISLNDLNYYLSRSFTMVVSEQYDNPKIEIRNGALVVNDQQQVSQLTFTNTQAGKLHGFPVSGSIDVFEVVFKSGGKDIAMRFRKTQSNIFELYSAVIDTRPYNLHSDEGLPLLSINSNMARGDSEVQAFPSAQAAQRSRNVEGAGSLNKSGVVEYIKSQKAPLSDSEIERIVQTYFDEAAFENINHDIAIAQMLHASNFLKNNQRVSGFNYSGLIELPNWNGNFSSMTEGVRAHIQHIKGYASTTLNRQQIADPRYYLLVNLKYLGTVKTFDQLYEKWTASPANYKQNIERILNGLYQYSPR